MPAVTSPLWHACAQHPLVQRAILEHASSSAAPLSSQTSAPDHKATPSEDTAAGCRAGISSPSEADTSTADLSFIDYQPDRYDELLANRSSSLTEQFRGTGLLPESVHCEVHPSVSSHYRLRCGFGIYDPEAADQWRLRCPAAVQREGRLRYVYSDENGGLVPVGGDQFPIASPPIYQSMPTLLRLISETPNLRRGIRAAKFLSTMTGELLITLVYKQRSLQEEGHPTWKDCATQLMAALGPQCKGVIGRSKGVKECVGRAFVTERGIVLSADAIRGDAPRSSSGVGRALVYHQPDEAFSNPNGGMAIHTLNWLCSCTLTIRQQRRDAAANSIVSGKPVAARAEATRDDLGDLDLLELYSGNGNHTMALSTVFDKVLAVEINPKLVKAGEFNAKLNGATNVRFLCVNAAHFSRNILGSRSWTDKVGSGSEYNFDVVLVDPPRAGLDKHTCRKIANYGHIMYISCNPEALQRDLQVLKATHETVRFAFFDHFPYTKHVECGVLLTRKCGVMPPVQVKKPPRPVAPLASSEQERDGGVRGVQLQQSDQEMALSECSIFDQDY